MREHLLLAAQLDVWVWWHIHQCGWGGKKNLSLTETQHLFETNTGHMLKMSEIHCFSWLIDWCDAECKPQGDQWTHPPRQKVLNGTRRKVCVTIRAQRQRHKPGHEQTDGSFSWGKGQRVKNTIGSVTKQIGLSILGLPLETNYFVQPQTNLFSDGQRKCLSCTYTNDQLQTQSTFYANGSTTYLI